MARSKTKGTTQVESLRHNDKRRNIPTEELRDFVADDEKHPKTMLYPRDPSLDPQLVWKGKDEQDSKDLAVPVVPVYIQEKIHPHAIIDDFKAQAKKDEPQAQFNLFSDFNGIEFEQLIDFYQHEQNWSNRMILGDSLLVMTSLAEKEGLKSKVQMIYLDPPYGIDFKSNWQVSTRKVDLQDTKTTDVSRQPEQIKAFRDAWRLGIHSYLAYLRDRLVVARDLLTETGSIFVQIGTQNVHLLRILLDEVFGPQNCVEMIAFRKKGMPLAGQLLEGECDYIVWYAKNKESVKFHRLFLPMNVEGDNHWNWIETSDGFRRTLSREEINNHALLPTDAEIYRIHDLFPTGVFATGMYTFEFEGKRFTPPSGKCWKTPEQGMRRAMVACRLQQYKGGETLQHIIKLSDYPVTPLSNVWGDTAPPFRKVYVVQTAPKVIERCLLMTTDPGDLVLDPTCGGATMAFVAEQWGRRWITIDTSRVALALARTRLMAAKYPYYLLADSPEGTKKEAEATGTLPKEPEQRAASDVKKGFVYKRVPHITLKSIANNERIDTIHAAWEHKLGTILAELNAALKQSWQEWGVPWEAEKKWPEKVKSALASWWDMRRARQKEIDEVIAKAADYEILYDQPYENSKKMRVTGPFTVESLSPHRVLSTEEDIPSSEAEGKSESSGQFETMILENLKKAGVQNTVKNERLKFDRLEPYAGKWLHAEGEYTENDKAKRAAVCIGPEHGTVGPDLIKEAAKEAVQGIGFDLLIVCGFAFDPHVSEEVKRYGKLTILPTRMNADLSMGDELLKKTGSGNLFMVFGEPDLKVDHGKDGFLTVELKGLDIYDPTTGEIRANSTDDIACWFIDTNYNGESFFVRHAYFTGADRPYEKLSKALKAEINEDAWEQLYRTKSRPFKRPDTGKIAVKVINHYGDEVLRVYDIKNGT